MGLLSRLVGEGTADKISDGMRGRPEGDLRAYAASRGLDFRGQSSQAGYLGAFTVHPELQWNVMRGVLPGGEPGVLLHEVKLFEEGVPGTFYGVKSGPAGGVKMRDLIPGSGLISPKWNYFRSPHTSACVRIPEATGSLHGLFVARRSERYRSGDDQIWRRRDLSEFGIEGWAAVVRKDADRDVADAVLGGPVREILSYPREDGFTVEFMYGQLVVYQQNFLDQNGELDHFCALVSRLAGAIRELCEPALRPQPFETMLPEPDWLEFVQSRLDEHHILYPQGVWLERVAGMAKERGLRVETGLAFHRAFSRLPVPGEAFGVLRGDGIRLLSCIERSIRDISDIQRIYPDAGGPVGCDAVVLPAPGHTDSENGVDGVRTDWGRYAIRDELLVAWTTRPSWQATGEQFDALAANARGVLAA